jgi:fumarate hydratase subunit alpha
MREISCHDITQTIKELFIVATRELGEDVVESFKAAHKAEVSAVGKDIFEQLLENARLACEEKIPMCQDTGYAIVFAELGQDVHIVGGDFNQAIQEGVRQAYTEGFLRKSMCHPFTRKNTGDNTPAIMYLEMVPGDRLKITAVPKGGGGENMSRVFMLTPSVGVSGIKQRVLDTVREAGPNPCPPTIVGVGIGGSFEQCALQAKKALLRPLGQPNPEPEIDALEKEWLQEINRLGIGPQGLGGKITSLGLHIRMIPCHIGCLPVAINLQCHAARHKEAIL